MTGDALHDLVAAELGRIGIRAQDEIDDAESWVSVSEELGTAWQHLYGRRFEEAATIAARVKVKVEKIIRKENRGTGRQ